MLTFERVTFDEVSWPTLEGAFDHSVCQLRPWMEFIAECQGAEPVIARILNGNEPVGYLTGMIFKKFGLRIFGSPFPGWTTLYMGITFPCYVPRIIPIKALPEFIFDGLGCVHFELMDRHMTESYAQELGWQYRILKNRQIDLFQPEEDIWQQMSNSSARYCIRKSEKAGVTVEEVPVGDTEFAGEYYAQLNDVFAKQSLVPTYGLSRVESLIRHLHPVGKLLLLRARSVEGECLATAIFPGSGAMAYFWGGASLRKHQKLNPNEPLVWHAIKYWRERGAVRFDFGGGGTYKKKYGGVEIEVPWLRKSKYPVLEQGRKVARRLVDGLQRLRGKARR